MRTESLHVELGARGYDIVIGPGLLASAGTRIAPLLRRNRVVVITDENVGSLHLAGLQQGLTAAGIAVEALVLPAGEKTKSWNGLETAVEWLITQKVERDD